MKTDGEGDAAASGEQIPADVAQVADAIGQIPLETLVKDADEGTHKRSAYESETGHRQETEDTEENEVNTFDDDGELQRQKYEKREAP